jgi:hypothetical protein
MSRRTALAAIGRLTADQWGMCTAAQARQAGVSRVDLNRLVNDRILERVADAARVYRLAGSPEDPELDGLRAGWLQLGPGRSWDDRVRVADAIVSHRSAAHVRGLGELIPTAHEFYVRRRHRVARLDLTLRVRSDLNQIAWSIWGGLPVCSVEQIVGDLLADREDESAVASICADAIRAGLTDDARLHAAVEPHAARYGSTPDGLVSRLTRVVG